MQAQMEKEKGALFGESEVKNINTTIKEITPHGIHLEVNQEGQFAGAAYNAREFDTLNLFLKLDGSYDWEIKVIHMTPEGDIITGSGRGTGRTTGPGTVSADGESLLFTQSPRLQSVNMTKLRVEASADISKGESHSKAYVKR